MEEKFTSTSGENGNELKGKLDNPLVFISHDTRDAEIAEAFSRLLKSVSAGMLKSFRSSDNKGTQGIEFGVEWYPKIIDSLQESSDVVCILTELSINRPWILFEAGMAKGKLNTPILGVSIGVPLSVSSTGPFAQFQNCADDVVSLTKLVNQLVRKLPNSEPDNEVIKQQVEAFKAKVQEILKAREAANVSETKDVKPTESNDNAAQLFEEVKIMFKELPSRIENVSLRNVPKPIRRFHPRMIEELLHYSEGFVNAKVGMQIALSPLRNDFPWLYESGMEAFEKAMKSKSKISAEKSFREFSKLIEFTFEHPIMREYMRDDMDYRYYRELPYLFDRFFREMIILREEKEVETEAILAKKKKE